MTNTPEKEDLLNRLGLSSDTEDALFLSRLRQYSHKSKASQIACKMTKADYDTYGIIPSQYVN